MELTRECEECSGRGVVWDNELLDEALCAVCGGRRVVPTSDGFQIMNFMELYYDLTPREIEDEDEE